MEVLLLGPVRLRVGGRVLVLGRPQQRLVLAALAVDAGRPVAMDTPAARVWDEPPAGARHTLHVLTSRLRRTLRQAGTALVHEHGGYRLDVDPQRIDLLRFRHLVAHARDRAADADRAALLRQALALWQGEALAGLTGQWAARTRLTVDQERLDGTVAWARTELQAGDPAAVITPLTELTGHHPLVEPLIELLMRALCATGRPAEALTVYEATRRRLADELGTDPAPTLRAVHQQILRGGLGPPPVAHRAPAPVPRQLPAAVPHLAGRSPELAALTSMLGTRTGKEAPSIVLALDGTGGVGKTALAVHWAHQIADRFTDGQLYVDLRGFDPTEPAMRPVVAIRGFLDTLGVPAQRVPTDQDAMAALYRSELATRRMLIVLDNARDTAQVRPLLPGTPGCLVVVTSRTRLSGLVAGAGARPVTVDLLSATGARELLTGRLGPARVAADPAAVDEIIERCARLPLALTIVAAHAAAQPSLPLREVVDELRDMGGQLDAFTTDDPTISVRAVFSWSYDSLPAASARLFRLLGLHPGPQFDAPAAASLAGVPAGTVRALLGELTTASLLVGPVQGRYTCHDLLRAYAADLCDRTEPDEQRHGATGRMLDHYLHTAHLADRLLDPTRDPVPVTAARPGVIAHRPRDHQQAMTWFTTRRQVLLAAVDRAEAAGFDIHAWQLPAAQWIFLDRRGHWHDMAAIGRTAVAATQRLADPCAAARCHRMLAHACAQLGRLEDARTQLDAALDLTIRTGDRTGQAHTLHHIGHLCAQLGDNLGALDHAQRALDLYRVTGDRPAMARALDAVGWYHALLGHHDQTVAICQQALTRTSNSVTSPGRHPPGAVSATPSIISAAPPRPSPATSRRSRCCAISTTATTKPRS